MARTGARSHDDAIVTSAQRAGRRQGGAPEIAAGRSGASRVASSARSEVSSGRLLIAVVAGVMGAFVIASFVVQRASATVDSLSDEIVSISAPSIERLASMRGEVFEIQLLLSEELHDGAATGGADAVAAPLESLDADIDGYLALAILRGEETYWRRIQSALTRFHDAVRRAHDLARRGALTDARAEIARGVEPSGQRLIQAALDGIDFHARNSRAFAVRIKQARRQSLVVANVSSAICVLLGIAGLLLVRAQTRRQRALVQAQAEFHQARADELEQFAGRVAHDIKSPLSTAHMAAELALPRAGDDAQRALIERIARALSRADAITKALLDFARAGARPDPGARTDVREVLKDLLVGLGPELERLRIDACVEPPPPVLVACS